MQLTSLTFYRSTLGDSHQYGLPFSKWFHDANSEYDVIFDCVKSEYLPPGMAIGWELAAAATAFFWSMRIKMPGDWLT